MTGLVEAVARALCRSSGFDPDQMMPNDELRWIYHQGAAQAAITTARPLIIEELRQPTPAMLDAFVARALQVSVEGEGGWTNYARNQWQTMFAAAIRGEGL